MPRDRANELAALAERVRQLSDRTNTSEALRCTRPVSCIKKEQARKFRKNLRPLWAYDTGRLRQGRRAHRYITMASVEFDSLEGCGGASASCPPAEIAMIEGARVIEFDTFDNAVMCAREHGGSIWQGDDDGRVVWFNPCVSMSVILTHANCKGRGFLGSLREAIERRHQLLALL